MNSFTPLLKVLAVFLIVLNIVVVAAFSIEESRWVRVITAAVFTWVYFFNYSKKTLFLLGALIAFLNADIFALSFDLDFSQNAFFTLHGLAYLFLFIHITKRADRSLLTRFQKLYILFAFVLCLALLLALGITFQEEIGGYWHVIFFYFHGLSAILYLIAALGFYDSTMNSFALFYLIAALCLIFSDLIAFSAQYLEARGFYYPNRIFYVTGLASLVQFAFLTTQSRSGKAEIVFTSEDLNEEEENFYHNY